MEIKTQKMIKNRDGMTTTTCDFLPGNERCSSSPISKIFSLASFVSPSKSPEDFTDAHTKLRIWCDFTSVAHAVLDESESCDPECF